MFFFFTKIGPVEKIQNLHFLTYFNIENICGFAAREKKLARRFLFFRGEIWSLFRGAVLREGGRGSRERGRGMRREWGPMVRLKGKGRVWEGTRRAPANGVVQSALAQKGVCGQAVNCRAAAPRGGSRVTRCCAAAAPLHVRIVARLRREGAQG